MLLPCAEHRAQASEDGPTLGFVRQIGDQPVGVEHLAVDAAVDATGLHARMVGPRAEQRVVVDGRDADE